jgi:WD40 repeat protein
MLILPGHKGRLRSISFSYDGKFLASCAGNGTAVSLWDTGRGRRLGFLSGHVARVTCVAFSPVEANLLASSDIYGNVSLWDAAAREMRGSFPDPGRHVSTMVFSPDGDTLAVARNYWNECSIGLGEVLTRRYVTTLTGAWRNILSMVFVGRQRILAIAHDRGIDRWETLASKRLGQSPHPRPVRALSCSTDGRTFASCAGDKVTLWDTESWQPRRLLKGHERLVKSLSFSPDNRTLASASIDGTVRLWDVESGEQRAAFDWQLGRVWTVAFAPDGMRAAAGGDKGKLILWDVDL